MDSTSSAGLLTPAAPQSTTTQSIMRSSIQAEGLVGSETSGSAYAASTINQSAGSISGGDIVHSGHMSNAGTSSSFTGLTVSSTKGSIIDSIANSESASVINSTSGGVVHSSASSIGVEGGTLLRSPRVSGSPEVLPTTTAPVNTKRNSISSDYILPLQSSSPFMVTPEGLHFVQSIASPKDYVSFCPDSVIIPLQPSTRFEIQMNQPPELDFTHATTNVAKSAYQQRMSREASAYNRRVADVSGQSRDPTPVRGPPTRKISMTGGRNLHTPPLSRDSSLCGRTPRDSSLCGRAQTPMETTSSRRSSYHQMLQSTGGSSGGLGAPSNTRVRKVSGGEQPIILEQPPDESTAVSSTELPSSQHQSVPSLAIQQDQSRSFDSSLGTDAIPHISVNSESSSSAVSTPVGNGGDNSSIGGGAPDAARDSTTITGGSRYQSVPYIGPS